VWGFALEEGIIDGALVTRMKKDRPLEPEPFIARTREEIIEASKSKYCGVPECRM
jgi:coenzyme F420 hydrogenase subunit beta